MADVISKSLDVKQIAKLLDEWEWFLVQAFSYFILEPLTLLNGQLDVSNISYNMQEQMYILTKRNSSSDPTITHHT